MHHFCHLDEPPEPTPLVTPPQSSDDEEAVMTFSLAAAPSERADLLLKRTCVTCVSRVLAGCVSLPLAGCQPAPDAGDRRLVS